MQKKRKEKSHRTVPVTVIPCRIFLSGKLWKYTPLSPSINVQYLQELCEKSSQTFAHELNIKKKKATNLMQAK